MATPLVMWCRQWLVTVDCHSSSTTPAPPTRRPGTVWSTTHLEEGRQVRDLVINMIAIIIIMKVIAHLTEKLIQETSITPRAATSTYRGI